MSIQITNSGSSIKITQNGGSFYIPKRYLVNQVPTVTQPNGKVREGQLVIQYSEGTENKQWSCVWSDITVPVVANIQAMVDAIEAFQDTGFGEDVNITSPLTPGGAVKVSQVSDEGFDTFTSSNEYTSITVTAGKKCVCITTLDDFSGFINNAEYVGAYTVNFIPSVGKLTPEIVISPTSGNYILNIQE